MVAPKKPAIKTPLSMVEIVMRADAETIAAALEARRKVDALLAERAAAYERIAALEKQVDDIMGEPNAFVFPPPPVPVAAFSAVAAVPAVKEKEVAEAAVKPVEESVETEAGEEPAAETHAARRSGKNN
jgi:hypothetical protein